MNMKRIVLGSIVALFLAISAVGCGGGRAPSGAEKVAATAEKAAANAGKAAATAQQSGELLAQKAIATKSAPPSATAAQGTASATAGTATRPAPTAVGKAAATATQSAPENAETPLSVNSRNSGLDQLRSYRAKWHGEWKATEGGTTESVTWDWFEEIVRDEQKHHWGVKTTDPKTGKVSQFEFWQIADATYMATQNDQGQQECVMMTQEKGQTPLSGMLAPDAFGGVSGARYVGTETVNGVRARHYKYDEKAATLAGFGRVVGDIWVAVDGGYVVKDTVSWEGTAAMFAANSKASGKGTWTFDVLDANKPLKIEPPEICTRSNVDDMPILPDAAEKMRMGAMTLYKTATKLADAVEFYKTAMAKAGWKLEGEPEISDAMASLQFVKGKAGAQITLMSESGKTQVMIQMSGE
ncbi:MAG: hypothetical protein ACP5UQ_15245 [Anaerolineae bacterium]